MKITLIQRYFWPESVLTNDIARWLVERGHDVVVITAQPSYHPEANLERQPWRTDYHGASILRVPLFPERRGIVRQLNGLFFVLQAFFLILVGGKRNVYWTTTMPPVVQALAVRVASWIKGGKFIYFLQDIYPEIALEMGILKPGLFSRLLMRLDSWTMSTADLIVPHTIDMAETVRRRGVNPRRVALINNFAPVEAKLIEHVKAPGPTKFVYAGNMGRFQNLHRLIAVFQSLDTEAVSLLLLGEGLVKADLIELTRGSPHIIFRGIVPQEEAYNVLCSCDVGIVSLAPRLINYAYPGKTFAYLNAGLPVLAFVEPDTELGRDLRSRDIGLAIGWQSSDDQLRAAILAVANRSFSQEEIRERSREMYDPGVAQNRWIRVFEDLGPQG